MNLGWARALSVAALAVALTLAAPAAFADEVGSTAAPEEQVTTVIDGDVTIDLIPATSAVEEPGITSVTEGEVTIDLIPATSAVEGPKPTKTGKAEKSGKAGKTGKANRSGKAGQTGKAGQMRTTTKPPAATAAQGPVAQQPAVDVRGTSADAAPHATTARSTAATSPASTSTGPSTTGIGAQSTAQPGAGEPSVAEVIDVLGVSSEVAEDPAAGDADSGMSGWIITAAALLVLAAGATLLLRRRSAARPAHRP